MDRKTDRKDRMTDRLAFESEVAAVSHEAGKVVTEAQIQIDGSDIQYLTNNPRALASIKSKQVRIHSCTAR